MTTSVDVDNNRIDHQPDGVQTDFTYDFQVNYQTWMFAYADGVLYEEVFTMTGIGDPVGGLCQFTDPPEGEIETLTLIRVVPLTQTIVYPPYGPFPPKSHEGALDKLTWITQQMQEELDRCLKVPVDEDGADVSMPQPDPFKTLMWNEDGTALENGPSEGDFQGWLQMSEDAAYQSALSAGQSQTSASASFTWMDFAQQWSSADLNVEVDDGVHPIGYSAYHWAQIAAEGGIVELTSDDTEMMQIQTPQERFRNLVPIHGTPGGMVKLDGNALVPFDQIPFDGALRLIGIYAGHDNCPKADIGVPESPCIEPDSRNPSQRWPSLVPNFGNGDYFIITQCEEPPIENHIDLLIAGDTVPIVTEVFNGDGIVYIDDNELGIQSGWYHVPGMANRGNLAQNVIFDDTFTTVKGENVQLWNQNLDQLAAQEAIRRDGTIPMTADLDFPAEFGIRGWGNIAGEYLDLLLTNATDEAVLGIVTNHPHIPTLPAHIVNKEYSDQTATGVVGEIKTWPGLPGTQPVNWIRCVGGTLASANYPVLFAAIGTMYGGSAVNFQVPNYEGNFLRMTSDSIDTDPDRATRTNRGDGEVGAVIGTRQVWRNLIHLHANTAVGTVGTLATGNQAPLTHVHAMGLAGSNAGGGQTTFPVRSLPPGANGNLNTGPSVGNHTHPVSGVPGVTLTNVNTGGNQANPLNVYVDYYIVGDIQ